ncbi:hypothetical protein [Haloarcula pelagica]|uniref:hypothetical protein n=1 Tax=Haloarcula pelagica TaxID=3033389 RepID=UPI0024C3081D|nr:hypothetical protein [Halomicroarcula sp. YJ-61-S]
MSQWHPEPAGHRRPVGAVATRLGTALLVVALPLATGSFLGLLAGTTVAAALSTAVTAVVDPPAASSLAWLFRVGALGVLAGSWILGFGLVVEELWA